MVDSFEIKPAEVPVAGWNGERNLIVDGLFRDGLLQLFEKLGEAFTVCIMAATVAGTRVLLFTRQQGAIG